MTGRRALPDTSLLDGLDGLAVAEQVAALEELHAGIVAALEELDDGGEAKA